MCGQGCEKVDILTYVIWSESHPVDNTIEGQITYGIPNLFAITDVSPKRDNAVWNPFRAAAPVQVVDVNALSYVWAPRA